MKITIDEARKIIEAEKASELKYAEDENQELDKTDPEFFIRSCYEAETWSDYYGCKSELKRICSEEKAGKDSPYLKACRNALKGLRSYLSYDLSINQRKAFKKMGCDIDLDPGNENMWDFAEARDYYRECMQQLDSLYSY